MRGDGRNTAFYISTTTSKVALLFSSQPENGEHVDRIRILLYIDKRSSMYISRWVIHRCETEAFSIAGIYGSII
jgi:archaellum component FlaD/FlaE